MRVEEIVVATGTRRRNDITRLVEDVVDGAKEFVEDAVDRAKDLDRDSREAVRRIVSDDGRDRSSREIDELKSALDDLTAKVNHLLARRVDRGKPAP